MSRERTWIEQWFWTAQSSLLQALGIVGEEWEKNPGGITPPSHFSLAPYYAESLKETSPNLIPRSSKGGRGERAWGQG